MNVSNLSNTKSRAVLRSIEHRSRDSKFSKDAEKHYAWMNFYFRTISYPLSEGWVGPIRAKKILFLLAKSFDVLTPNLIILKESREYAETFFLDGFIGISYTYCTIGVISHEFTHWYLWHKCGIILGHNTSIMKRFEADLNLILANYCLGLDLHVSYVCALRDIGEIGKLEQWEEEYDK